MRYLLAGPCLIAAASIAAGCKTASPGAALSASEPQAYERIDEGYWTRTAPTKPAREAMPMLRIAVAGDPARLKQLAGFLRRTATAEEQSMSDAALAAAFVKDVNDGIEEDFRNGMCEYRFAFVPYLGLVSWATGAEILLLDAAASRPSAAYVELHQVMTRDGRVLGSVYAHVSRLKQLYAGHEAFLEGILTEMGIFGYMMIPSGGESLVDVLENEDGSLVALHDRAVQAMGR